LHSPDCYSAPEQTGRADIHSDDAIYRRLALAVTATNHRAVRRAEFVHRNREHRLAQNVVLPANYPWLDLTGADVRPVPPPAAPGLSRIIPQPAVAGAPATVVAGDVSSVGGYRQIPNGDSYNR
jgi:hypothetical protein